MAPRRLPIVIRTVVFATLAAGFVTCLLARYPNSAWAVRIGAIVATLGPALLLYEHLRARAIAEGRKPGPAEFQRCYKFFMYYIVVVILVGMLVPMVSIMARR